MLILRFVLEPEYLRFLDELEAAKNQTIMTMEEQLRHVQLLESTSKGNINSLLCVFLYF